MRARPLDAPNPPAASVRYQLDDRELRIDGPAVGESRSERAIDCARFEDEVREMRARADRIAEC